MGRMKLLSESVPASSEVFWNRFRVVAPKSALRYRLQNKFPESTQELAPESVPESETGPESESTPELKMTPKSE